MWVEFLPPPSAVMGSNDQVYQSAWRTGDRFDLYVYVSDSPSLTTFLQEDLVWHQSGLEFGSYKEDQYPTADLSIRFRGRNPLDLFAHVYAVKRNVDPNTPHSVLYRRKTMAGSDWWYPELDISVVSDPEPYDLSVLHPLAVQQMALDSSTHTYTPIMYLNDFWHIKSRRVPLSGDEMPLKVTFSPLSLYKYQLLLAFDHSFQVNEALLDGEGGLGGVDSIKESLRSTQPWILFLTLAVTCLHAIFDMLAFKNDVQFWRKQEDLSGLSTRSILVNAIFQFIILLYLFEQGTSTVVLASTAIGLAIEVWKIFRVLHVAVGWSRFGLPYPVFRDRPSYKGETKDHDETAMWYLFLVATPLLIGYAIYSLIYESYKSLYSWLLSTLVGFVYAFGISQIGVVSLLMPCRFHYDDPATVHQLQAEIRSTPSMARLHLQIPQHLYRRPLLIHHQDAPLTQTRVL